jgi:signal transduction histidine kinase
LGNDTEGKNRFEAVDSKGNHYIKDIINNGKKDGGGYSDYYFPKKDGTEPLPKRGYSLELSLLAGLSERVIILMILMLQLEMKR